MRTAKALVFDRMVSGTGVNWYTSAEFNRLIGENAEQFAVHAYVTSVSGTTPTLTVASETSGDGENWVATTATPELNGVAIASNGSYVVQNGYWCAENMRFRVSLGGASPQCRLKIYYSGHKRSA